MFKKFDAKAIEEMHEFILSVTPGLSGIKTSTIPVIEAVANSLYYEGPKSVGEISAQLSSRLARSHCFNDANKRTAYSVYVVSRKLNDLPTDIDADVEKIMVDLASGAQNSLLQNDGPIISYDEYQLAEIITKEEYTRILSDKMDILQRLADV